MSGHKPNESLRSSTATFARYLTSLIATRTASFVLIAVIWAMIAVLSRGSLPGPRAAFQEFRRLADPAPLGYNIQPDPSIWLHLAASAARAYGALLLSTVVFLPIGVICGAQRAVYRMSIGLVEFARSIPAFMLLLVLLAVGITDEWARIACVSFACGMLLLDYIASAVRNVSPENLDVMRAIGASRFYTFRRAVWIPMVLHGVLPTLRIGVGVALIVTLVVETLAEPELGMGVLLNASLGRVSIAGALALIVSVGAVGWLGNLAVTIVSDVLWWVFGGKPLLRST